MKSLLLLSAFALAAATVPSQLDTIPASADGLDLSLAGGVEVSNGVASPRRLPAMDLGGGSLGGFPSTNLPIFTYSGDAAEGTSAFVVGGSGRATYGSDRLGQADGALVMDGTFSLTSASAVTNLPLGSSSRTVSAWIRVNTTGAPAQPSLGLVLGWGNFNTSGVAGTCPTPSTRGSITGTPRHIDIDAWDGSVYVAEASLHRILKIFPNGTSVVFAGTSGIAGSGGDGLVATRASFNTPFGIAVHPLTGDVYVADTNNHRIRRISRTTNVVTTVLGTGSAVTSTWNMYNGLPTATPIHTPIGLAFSPDGALFVVERGAHRVTLLSADGTFAVPMVNQAGVAGFSGDGSLAIDATLNSPEGIAVSPDGSTVVIADAGNHRLRAFTYSTTAPRIMRTILGNGVGSNTKDGGLATQATVSYPVALVFDAASNLFVSSANTGVIRRIDAVNGTVSTVLTTGSPSIYGLALTQTGELWVAELSPVARVRAWRSGCLSNPGAGVVASIDERNGVYALAVPSGTSASLGAATLVQGPWSNAVAYLNSASPSAADGAWHHIAATYDAVTSLSSLYVDGVLASVDRVTLATFFLLLLFCHSWWWQCKPECMACAHWVPWVD